MFYIVTHLSFGLNFQQMEDLVQQMWSITFKGKHLCVVDDRLWNNTISRKAVSSCFTYHYLLHEEKYNSHMAQFTGNWLSMDHTFKTATNIGI